MALFVGAYWGPRAESREACADRLSKFLRELAERDSIFSQWFKKAMSRKKASVAIPTEPIALAPHLKGNHRDIGGELISELGFSFSAWTGREANVSVSLDVACGAYSHLVGNSVLVSFDPAASPSLDLLQEIMKTAVAAFDPEEAVVNSTERLSPYAPLPAWKVPALFRYRLGSGFTAD